MNPEIFKAYDIRGIYPTELDEQGTYKIAKAFIHLLKQENPEKKLKIVVARDMRLSSPSLKEQVIKAVTNMGVDVIDIDLASSPTFYFTVAKNNYDGGLIISASHNPKEYNGIKIVRARAIPIGLINGLDKIRDLTEQEIKESEIKGTITKEQNALEQRTQYALNFYNFEKIKPLKVVIDTANAMGAPDFEELFKHIPCQLIKMNFPLDGTFPAHQADPFKEENVIDIKKRVIQEQADLGIALDGDADRIFFIDNKGEFVEPGIIRGILSKEVLKHKPNSRICYDIRPGMITKDMIIENGGTASITKVGHTLIKLQSIEEGAEFAGESSGHFFFKTDYGFYETPLIVALIILKEISETNKTLSEITTPLKKYFHSSEINSIVKDKEAVMNRIEQHFKESAKSISHLDGISIEHEDYWFNVRPSNTESLLRLNLEARTKEIMEQKRDEVLKIIQQPL